MDDGVTPDFSGIEAAAARIAGDVLTTPVVTGRGGLDARLGARLYFKCENLQRSGAFKFRGALNAVRSLDAESRARGVATHSSGNHGAALALAAQLCGLSAWVVMPEGSARVKIEAVRAYGGRIRYCAAGQAAREAMLAELLEETGAVFVPPYDDRRVIAGQGTAALELLRERPDLEVIMAPVGGGGLLSGTALAASACAPAARVVGAEPAQADDARRSLRAGRLMPSHDPDTMADGLRTSLSERTFGVISRLVDEIVTAEEAEIAAAMRLLWERLKLVVEPSAAVPLAALLAGRLEVAGREVGIILSGGNVDLERLPWR